MMRRDILISSILALVGVLPVTAATHKPDTITDTPLQDFSRPPGMMVDVGTHKMHLYCRGHGTPVVIFESGIGGFSLEWVSIQRDLAGETRVCVYDRAGYGWSQYGPPPRTTDRITEELRRLLDVAEVPAPYVLVGHSFGGYTAQLFARRYPYLTAAVVLVDASHPQQSDRFPALASRAERAVLAQVRERWDVSAGMQPNRRTAMARVVLPDNYPEEARLQAMWLMSLTKTGRTLRRELMDFETSGHEIEAAAKFPDLPLVVLSRGRREWLDDNSVAVAKEMAWSDLQRDLTGLSHHSIQIVGHESGHMLHLDQPELVIAAVLQLIHDYRNRHSVDTE
jgi:pimeloyl-ACP methyl ester carboxylesterase